MTCGVFLMRSIYLFLICRWRIFADIVRKNWTLHHFSLGHLYTLVCMDYYIQEYYQQG